MLITPCLVEPVERERGALRVLRLAAVLAARLAPLVPVAGHEALRPRQALPVPLAAAAPRPVPLHVAAEAVAARRVVAELGAAGAVPAAPLAAVLRAFKMTLDELSSFAKVVIVTMQSLFPGSFPQFLLQIMSLKSLSSSSAPEGGGPHRRRTCDNKRGEMITNFERERQCWDLELPVRWRRQRHPRVVVAGPTTWLAAPSFVPAGGVWAGGGREGGEVGASESRGPGYLYLRFYHNKCLGPRIRNGENLP